LCARQDVPNPDGKQFTVPPRIDDAPSGEHHTVATDRYSDGRGRRVQREQQHGRRLRA
jgi:hypothetical protein